MVTTDGPNKKQQGFVSLFTVIFFMLLISVITISFLRIMAIEQRQALDNDLTASALASAESGVEDAKRAILKYSSLPDGNSLKNDLKAAFTSSACDSLFSSASIRTALNIRNDGSITGQPGLNQFYTCLSVNLNSPDYVSNSTAGKSEFIPLRTENDAPFDRIKVSWHFVDTAANKGDGTPQNYATDLSLPQVTGGTPAYNWSTRVYPAYMRAEVYGFLNGNFSRNEVNDRTRGVFLVPMNQASPLAVDENTSIPLSIVDPLPHTFDTVKTGVRGIRCKGVPPGLPPATGTYACAATIELPSEPGLRGNNNHYYLRLTPIYGATHFKAELKNGVGGAVNFSEVQPIIDATGRASDVFRRVQARVRLDSISDLPEYTAESANTICKNMQVSDGSFYQPNNCP